MHISENQRYLEIAAVVLTGLGKFVFVDYLENKFAYIFITIGCWLAYLIYNIIKKPDLITYWGFTKKNFFKTFRHLAVAGISTIVLFAGYAIYKGHFKFNWHLIVILLIYPFWGTIQQYLMMSLIGGNLKDSRKINMSDNPIILITALSFSLVHLPVIPLTVATFILALVYARLFLKYRNLWPLGIFHGWLGALFFFWVLNRDSYTEVFGGLGI